MMPQDSGYQGWRRTGESPDPPASNRTTHEIRVKLKRFLVLGGVKVGVERWFIDN